MLPALTRCYHPDDYAFLEEELVTVDAHFGAAAPQHPARRWEYALALHAYGRWLRERDTVPPQGPIYDVGGSGSPFYRMLPDPYQVIVIDPNEPDHLDLAACLRDGVRLASAVCCLSVLEHVDDLEAFLYHLSCLVAPGGLLVLTMDACDDDLVVGWPQDTYHYHWMRKRIFNAYARVSILLQLQRYQFDLFGERDPLYHGPHVFDYTFASLVLRKRAC